MASSRKWVTWLSNKIQFEIPRVAILLALLAAFLNLTILVSMRHESINNQVRQQAGITCVIVDERLMWVTVLRGLGYDTSQLGIPLAPSPQEVDQICHKYLKYNKVDLPPPSFSYRLSTTTSVPTLIPTTVP